MRQQALKEYGPDDPMTDMASISEDSAWCAMQTRFMEMRADRDCMKRAQAVMEEDRLECEREARAEREEEALKMYRQMQVYNRLREEKKPSAAILFWYLFLLIWPRTAFDVPSPSRNFNAIAA